MYVCMHAWIYIYTWEVILIARVDRAFVEDIVRNIQGLTYTMFFMHIVKENRKEKWRKKKKFSFANGVLMTASCPSITHRLLENSILLFKYIHIYINITNINPAQFNQKIICIIYIHYFFFVLVIFINYFNSNFFLPLYVWIY